MNIIHKEILDFSEKELEALGLVSDICLGLMREASDPDLVELARRTFDNLSDLLGYCEED